jgi:hypothetical protein
MDRLAIFEVDLTLGKEMSYRSISQGNSEFHLRTVVPGGQGDSIYLLNSSFSIKIGLRNTCTDSCMAWVN